MTVVTITTIQPFQNKFKKRLKYHSLDRTGSEASLIWHQVFFSISHENEIAFTLSEFGSPGMYHHAILTVGENQGFGRMVLLQILLDCRSKETKFVMINVTKVSEHGNSVGTLTSDSRSFKNQIFRELVNPVMPLTKACFQIL